MKDRWTLIDDRILWVLIVRLGARAKVVSQCLKRTNDAVRQKARKRGLSFRSDVA